MYDLEYLFYKFYKKLQKYGKISFPLFGIAKFKNVQIFKTVSSWVHFLVKNLLQKNNNKIFVI